MCREIQLLLGLDEGASIASMDGDAYIRMGGNGPGGEVVMINCLIQESIGCFSWGRRGWLAMIESDANGGTLVGFDGVFSKELGVSG